MNWERLVIISLISVLLVMAFSWLRACSEWRDFVQVCKEEGGVSSITKYGDKICYPKLGK